MSYGYMTKEVGRLRAEIDELLKRAQDVDAQDHQRQYSYQWMHSRQRRSAD